MLIPGKLILDIDVYLSVEGYLCVKQTDADGETEHLILVHESQQEAFINAVNNPTEETATP